MSENTNKNPSLITRAEFARKLGVSQRTVLRMEQAGLIRRVELPFRLVRYSSDAVDRLVGVGTAAPDGE